MKGLLIFSVFLYFLLSGSVVTGVHKAKFSNYNYGVTDDSSHIKILSNYHKINSISELLDSFKGKPAFIDLWATWCSPCFKEFKYSDTLYKFLNEKGIDLIYVSFDKDPEDTLWKNKIKENSLFGNHIRANKLLRDNITTLIWGGIDAYSIPNYLLFDKNKRLLNQHSSPPSTGIKLFKEIESELQ